MSQKDLFANKTALILGADSPLGRAAALQLSRAGCAVVLAARNARSLEEVARFVYEKGGVPHEVLLPGGTAAQMSGALRERRDQLGHYHFAINALAFPGAGSTDEARAAAAAANEALFDLAAGRGAARFATLWPVDLPAPAALPGGGWHCLVRISGVGSSEEDTPHPKPASVADSVMGLFRCPPGACPVEVQLSPRNLKA